MKKIYANSIQFLTIPVGEKLILGTYGSGEVLIQHLADTANIPSFYDSQRLKNGTLTLEGYDADHEVKITTGMDYCEYDIGENPTLKSISKPLLAQSLSQINMGNNVFIITSDGVPVNYTDGDPSATGEGVTGPGSICIDYVNSNMYINTGTKAEPIWGLVSLTI